VTVDIFLAITPYVTFFLAIIIGIIAWFLKWMANGNQREFKDLKKSIGALEGEIRALEKERRVDQKYMYEQYVDKEAFYLAVGKTEGLISRIFDQLNELSQAVHKLVGAVNVKNADKVE
jgi:succinylglutamate desuccinylase